MRALLLVVAALLLLSTALNAQVGFLTLAIVFLAALAFLSWAWSQLNVRGLRVERHAQERAFVGESFTVDVTVTNTGRLPVTWIEVTEPLSLALTDEPLPVQAFDLGPREQRLFTYTIRCRRRGNYHLGPALVRTGDVLGFAEQAVERAERQRLIVYPRVVPLDRLTFPAHAPLALLRSASALFEDPTRVSGVRDYVPGDSVWRIHWTASARLDRLVVKQYQRGLSRDTLVCLDLGLDGYELHWRSRAVETAIEVAASVAYHVIMREDLAAGIATEAMDGESGASGPIVYSPARGEAHLMVMLELLARVQPAAVKPLAHRLRGEVASLPFGATVVVVTGRLTEELDLALLGLKRSGFSVVVLLVEPAHAPPPAAALSRVPVYHVTEDFIGAWA